MIKTSIIVPVYNTAEYLWECFESIFNQTQKEIEVIAINDGSTDNSLQILKEIKRKYPQLIIVSQENSGLGSTRNRGIELAQGDYIYFIDSDDCLVETAMETCYTYASEHGLDFLMFDAEIFGDISGKENFYDRKHIVQDKGKVLSGAEYANRYWLKTFCPSACLVYLSAEFIRENNIYFLPKVYYEDNEYHCKIMSLAKHMMYIPDVLYRRRYREASITTSKFEAEDLLQVIKAISCIPRKCDMEEIMHKIEVNSLQGLLNRCKSNQVLLKGQFGRAFYETALKICDYKSGIAKNFHDIDLIYQLSCLLDDDMVTPSWRDIIADKKRQTLCEMFSGIAINQQNHNIGIYGTGKNAKDFLKEYQDNVDEIKADLFFIDSYVETGTKKYQEHDIYNVNDIGALQLECIIIASSKYEEKMCDVIQEKYGNKFPVICLRKDLGF